MKNELFVVLLGVGLCAAGAAASAHHAFSAEFDAQKPVTLKGTVTKMEWINPHAWIHIDVQGPNGKTEEWMVEASTPNNLVRRGFTRNSLAPGTLITVEGYQAKDGAQRANGTTLTYEDGRHLFIGSAGTGAPVEPPKQ
jgi:hypothetical protein